MIALLLAAVIAVAPVQVSTQTIGYAESSYQGKWYHPKWEKVRKCIMFHESRFNYRAKKQNIISERRVPISRFSMERRVSLDDA